MKNLCGQNHGTTHRTDDEAFLYLIQYGFQPLSHAKILSTVWLENGSRVGKDGLSQIILLMNLEKILCIWTDMWEPTQTDKGVSSPSWKTPGLKESSSGSLRSAAHQKVAAGDGTWSLLPAESLRFSPSWNHLCFAVIGCSQPYCRGQNKETGIHWTFLYQISTFLSIYALHFP